MITPQRPAGPVVLDPPPRAPVDEKDDLICPIGGGWGGAVTVVAGGGQQFRETELGS